MIHEARTIPEAGQSFTFHGFRFRVLKKERNRITALHVTPLEPQGDDREGRVKGTGSEAGSGFPLLLIAGSGTCVTAARALSAAAAA